MKHQPLEQMKLIFTSIVIASIILYITQDIYDRAIAIGILAFICLNILKE